MKKILALVLMLALVACASLALAEEPAVMTAEEYAKAAIDDAVCVEAYVQAAQGWWEKDGVGRQTLYLEAEDGAGYFAYEVPMTKEESEKLVPGTKIRISGYKAEWSGEVEIIEGKYEILEAEPFIAEAEDVTALLGTDELINHMNEKVAIKGAKIVAYTADGVEFGEELPFSYAWDNSGSRDGNSDLYFKIEVGGAQYTMTVESYLCSNETDVYKAVEGLKIGDVVDLEGFLYWYNGANPHITSVTAAQ